MKKQFEIVDILPEQREAIKASSFEGKDVCKFAHRIWKIVDLTGSVFRLSRIFFILNLVVRVLSNVAVISQASC